MDELTFKSYKPNTFNKLLRISCILGGTALAVFYPEFLASSKFSFSTLFIKFFGVAMIVLAVVDPLSLFWKDRHLLINDKFIRTIDELSIERTAYWKKVSKIILSRFSMRLFYASGTGEEFHLPFIKNDDFKRLRDIVKNKSEEHQIELREKPWWKIF